MIDRSPKPWTVWLAKAADGRIRAMAKSEDRSVSAESCRCLAEEALAEVDRVMAARLHMKGA